MNTSLVVILPGLLAERKHLSAYKIEYMDQTILNQLPSNRRSCLKDVPHKNNKVVRTQLVLFHTSTFASYFSYSIFKQQLFNNRLLYNIFSNFPLNTSSCAFYST